MIKRLFTLLLTLFLTAIFSSSTYALTPDQKRLIDGGILYYNEEVCEPGSGGSTGATSDLDRILQTFAMQESGGDPTSQASGSTASGKYGFLNSTWGSIGGQFYPPSSQWARAHQAPEEVQDAVMYLWYTDKFKIYEGDVFKMAVSHFLPAALTDPSKMDQIPPGNVHTPREYGEIFMGRLQSGEGSDIPLKYQDAPDFAQYLEQVGGAPDGASAPSGGVSAAADGGTVIAIDPGHGGAVAEYVDPVTGLGDRESTNSPEREDMQEVANQAKSSLEQAGYTVILTKTSADEAISKRERIDKAKQAGADLGLSLHSYSGFGTFENWAEVWPQFVGGYRQSAADPNIRVEFTNEEVAKLSDEYANVFTEERDKAERDGSGVTQKVVGQASSFSPERGLPSHGDLSLVQLWADDIPWVYHEAGADANGGLTPEQIQKYATGIVNGVKRALPAASGGKNNCGSSSTVGNGNATSTALEYAWNEYKGKPYLTMKPEYEQAMNTARANGQYVGGVSHPGVDCGGFVTRVMIDSGFEPNYNHSGTGGFTGIQLEWARENWQKIGVISSTSELQPGDVAFQVTSSGDNDGHTFMYVGDQTGFETQVASASLDSRAPMAGKERIVAGNIEWYRKK